jgi:hypothetical protein
MLLLGVDWLVGTSRTPQEYLEKLQNPNPDIRWRAANDLAQVLKRDQDLASDADFALRLAERYQQAIKDFEQSEREFLQQQGKLSPQELKREQENLRGKRNYAIYLGSCLGNSNVPVGAPLLAEVARTGPSRDKENNALFRRQAVWALANLGNNLKRDPQEKTLTELKRQAGTSSGERQQWAQQALNHLEHGQPLGVIDALAATYKDNDIFLRGLVAMCLNFWDEGVEKNRLAEQTLVRLSEDPGDGEWIYVDVSGLPSLPGRR